MKTEITESSENSNFENGLAFSVKSFVFLVAFVLSSSSWGNEDWYNQNLATTKHVWDQVLNNTPLKHNGVGIVSPGPWYIDVNHRESSLLVGPAVLWTNDLDLTNTIVRIDVAFHYAKSTDEYDVTNGGILAFWFQTELERGVAGGNFKMPDRYVNYVRLVNFLSHAERGEAVEIYLSPSLDDWLCLGRNQIDVREFIGSAAKYTCALGPHEFRRALKTPTQVGILFLLPRNDEFGNEISFLSESNPNRTLIMGGSTFVLKEFTIIKY